MGEQDRDGRGHEVVLFGGGGHARSVADSLQRAHRRVVCVVDPGGWHATDVESCSSDDEGVRMVQDRALSALVVIGDNTRRLALVRQLEASGIRLATFTATTATCSAEATVGVGTMILEHAHVGPRASVGAATIVNTGAIVEHDVRVGEGAHIAPRSVLGGAASCGDRTMIGTGAVVLPGVAVGSDVIVGAGAVVREAVPDGVTVVGVPAREVRR